MITNTATPTAQATAKIQKDERALARAQKAHNTSVEAYNYFAKALSTCAPEFHRHNERRLSESYTEMCVCQIAVELIKSKITNA